MSALIFGWTLQEEVGGMAVPIISGFFGGFGLTGSFNGLNTYNAGTFPTPWIQIGMCFGVNEKQKRFRQNGQRSLRESISCSISLRRRVRRPCSRCWMLLGLGGRLLSVCLLLSPPSLSYLYIYLRMTANVMAGVVLSLIGGFLVWAITRWGLDMQQWAERKFELDKKPGF